MFIVDEPLETTSVFDVWFAALNVERGLCLGGAAALYSAGGVRVYAWDLKPPLYAICRPYVSWQFTRAFSWPMLMFAPEPCAPEKPIPGAVSLPNGP